MRTDYTGEVVSCRSCCRPIVWIRLLPGLKRHPVDANAGPDGSIEIRPGKKSGEAYGKIVPKDERKGWLFTSHFASCPHAGDWRNKR